MRIGNAEIADDEAIKAVFTFRCGCIVTEDWLTRQVQLVYCNRGDRCPVVHKFTGAHGDLERQPAISIPVKGDG